MIFLGNIQDPPFQQIHQFMFICQTTKQSGSDRCGKYIPHHLTPTKVENTLYKAVKIRKHDHLLLEFGDGWRDGDDAFVGGILYRLLVELVGLLTPILRRQSNRLDMINK